MTALVAPSASDKVLAGLRAIILAQFPTFSYAGLWEYQVVAATAQTIDCVPTDSTIPLPSGKGWTFKPSLLGEGVLPTVGSVCLIGFVNLDPTKPRILSLDRAAVNATVDATGQLDLGASAEVVNIAGGGDFIVQLTQMNEMIAAIDAFIVIFNAQMPALASAFTALAQGAAATAIGTIVTAGEALDMYIRNSPSLGTTKTRAS